MIRATARNWVSRLKSDSEFNKQDDLDPRWAMNPYAIAKWLIMLRHVLAGLVVAVLIAGAAVAGPLEDADAANDRGDYATALSLYRPLAEQGNADAQTSLGDLYAGGAGVVQDYAEAVKWYRKSAEQGDARGQFFLGGMYEDGAGAPRKPRSGVRVVQPCGGQTNKRCN